MGKGIASLGSLAEQELCYHYDIIDVAGEEDAQLHETIQNLSDKVILSKSTEWFEAQGRKAASPMSKGSENDQV